jgi:hypothetical protein
MASASTRVKGNSRAAEGSDSDSDGDGPDDGDVDMEESRPEKQGPIVDDDGFELVQKRRK